MITNLKDLVSSPTLSYSYFLVYCGFLCFDAFELVGGYRILEGTKTFTVRLPSMFSPEH
jgi:hypothetical protein